MVFINSISTLHYNIYIITLLLFSDFIRRDLYSIILYRPSLFAGMALIEVSRSHTSSYSPVVPLARMPSQRLSFIPGNSIDSHGSFPNSLFP
jgi:hypothetical protein